MSKARVFTVDELNKMGVEAVANLSLTSVKGDGAQEAYEILRSEIRAMQKKGVTPLPVQP
jgi:hypothetical protein